MCTVLDALPASIALAIESALLIGIAKAWVWDCADDEDEDWPEGDEPKGEDISDELDAAVSMPMICPSALTSDPPESPGWMFAFVSIMPVRFSELPLPSSLAVIA
jgi:hypothetical protein